MARKRKAQTEIVPDEVPQAPTQEAQNTPNETPLENQDAEAAVEPSVSPNKKGLKSDVWPHFRREQINGVWKAICKACDKKLGGNTSAGSSFSKTLASFECVYEDMDDDDEEVM
ncbi:hypothetical protein QL285_043914 [Trifolium repens]|nr:hypothetical protein QL285_043914 [Trifolium repens]